MRASSIIGREHERASIETFLAEVAQGPRALVLSGEPGIGKTALWQAGVAAATHRFGNVLVCRGVEAEASLSFTGLSELILPVLEDVVSTLAPPRRRALEVALLLVEPGAEAVDVHAIGLAVLDVFRALAARGPVLVALDDAQWLDPASASVLQIAFRRLREEPVGALVTVRTGRETTTTFQLDNTFAADGLTPISLCPLEVGILHRLLKERLGLELSPPELARVEEGTAGNPFFALELGRELVRTNASRAAGTTLRVPESLHELLGGRLARLPPATLDFLLQVAALGRPTVELVTKVEGDRSRVLAAIEAGIHEGVIEVDDARIRFSHPMLAAICYEQAPIWKRRAVHQALAGAVPDVEERARHLALAAEGPDSAIASELDTAAERASARGAPAAAAELSELAALLTPDDPVLARQRRLRAATYCRLAGDLERAVAILEQLLREVPHGVERADVLFGLVMTQRADTPALTELYEEALTEAAGDDARASRILAWRMGIHLYEGDARGALVDAYAALEKAERAGDPFLLAVAISRTCQAEAYAVEVTPGLVERGMELEERLGLALESDESPRYAYARLLLRFGEIDRARALFEELEAQAIERGDEGTRVMILWPLSMLEWTAGRWPRALDHARAAHELTEQTRHPRGRAWVGRARALIEADLGLVDDARASAAESLGFSEATSKNFFAIATLGVLGHLEVALGDIDAAASYLNGLPDRLSAGGMVDPTLPVWADAIEVECALGELEHARRHLELYEANADKLGSPWAIASAARCRGVLAASERDMPGAFEAFDRSLSKLERHSFPFEHGRTLLCLGAARRQGGQRRAAREALEQALADFEQLGAAPWADRVRVELGRISGRRASSEELTETERRIGELAAHGHTNKEIAATLFMGVSTVEAHLSHVYRKLGVRRAELATRLAIPVDDPTQTQGSPGFERGA